MKPETHTKEHEIISKYWKIDDEAESGDQNRCSGERNVSWADSQNWSDGK